MAKCLKIAAFFVDFVKLALILTKTCLQTPTIVIKYNYSAHMWPVNRTGKKRLRDKRAFSCCFTLRFRAVLSPAVYAADAQKTGGNKPWLNFQAE